MKDKKTTAEMKDEMNTVLALLDNYDQAGLAEVLKKYNVTSPLTNNDITEPVEFNLMFATQIGPAGNMPGYVRFKSLMNLFTKGRAGWFKENNLDKPLGNINWQ